MKIISNLTYFFEMRPFLQDRVVLLSADITAKHLYLLLREMEPDCRDSCIEQLSKQPFLADISQFGYEVTFHGKLSDKLVEGRSGEKFRPIIVEKIITMETIAQPQH
jgi:hypothetical protein